MKQVVASFSVMAKVLRGRYAARRHRGGGNKLYPYIPLSTRAERKKQLVEQKVAFEKGKPKHRYVGIYAPNRRIKRAILQALRWQTFPYPKREPSPQDRVQAADLLDPIPKTYAASVP
jgi:hypothetical protein